MIKFGMFVLIYSFTKLIRIMMAATVFMSLALLVCQVGKSRTWRLNLAMFVLVPLAYFMSYSKLFFTGKFMLLTNMIYGLLKKREAICYFYFLVVVVLAARFIYRQRRLRHSLKYMKQMSQENVPTDLLQGKGPTIQVYLSMVSCSPFAGGMIKPFIVVPQEMQNSLSKEEFHAVLCHEALHIRQGHVFILNIYAILKILWWIHPLVYICDWKLRENMEYSSDEGCVSLSSLSVYEYANVMLKTLQQKNQVNFLREGVTTFSQDCFIILKRRLERLGAIQKTDQSDTEYKKKRKVLATGIFITVITVISLVSATSFPRYTKMEEISVFDEKLRPLTYDMAAEGFQAEIQNGDFHISTQELEKLAAKYGLHEEYVIFCYDTIVKVPGVGGLGQAAMVNTADATNISLLARQELVDKLAVFVLKYLI